MKSKLKMNINTIMVLCILCLSFIANLVTVIINTQKHDIAAVANYRKIILPLNLLDFLKAFIILFMGFLLFRIIKKLLNRVSWNDKYYRQIKTIGWLSILVMVMDSVSVISRDQYIYRNSSLSENWAIGKLFSEAIVQTLFSSPIAWFLVLCIFLLADVLQYASELKRENESFI